ncbi:zinc finger protein 570 [Folsomia candida]|uniref:zinc finger protein 570 n=1 Tax=Folsomia candida TaxID=158441 RepID=UPI000B906024|nr:zinc finger protein 570 [Folsomia candida]
MEVKKTHRKLLGGQKPLVVTREKVDEGVSFQEDERLPPHSVQPREPTPRDDNHVQSPSTSRRAPKAKKSVQVGRKNVKPGRLLMGKTFPCKICLCPFTNRTSARLHARTHLNPHELEQSSIFHAKCPHCQKVFFDRRDFTDHVAAHEGRKNHVCPTCKQKFTHRANLTAHLVIHLSREERAEVRQTWRHGCYFCSQRFTIPSRLSRHLVVHTKEKVRCHICRKTFFTMAGLTYHRFLHLHDDEKVALVKQGSGRVCLFCRKIFPDNGAYHAHLVSHTKEKPFRCDQCGKRFGRKGDFIKHKRIHNADPRPFICADCDKAFSSKQSLGTHKKTVHRKVKDIACPDCGKKFGTKRAMVQHVKSVHVKIRHPCPHCGKTFTQKGHLGTHLKKIHRPE